LIRFVSETEQSNKFSMREYVKLLIVCVLYVLFGFLGAQNAYIPVDNYFSLWLAGGFGLSIFKIFGRKANFPIFFSIVLLQLLLYYNKSLVPMHWGLVAVVTVSTFIKWGQIQLAHFFLRRFEAHYKRMLFRQGKDAIIFLFLVSVIPAVLTTWLYVVVNQLYFSAFEISSFLSESFRLTVADTLGLFLAGPLFYSFYVLKDYSIKELSYIFFSYSIPFASAIIIGNDYIFLILTPAAIIAGNYVDIRKILPFHLIAMLMLMWMTTLKISVFSRQLQDAEYLLFMAFAFVASIVIFYTSITFNELKDHKKNLENKILERTSALEREVTQRRKTEEELRDKEKMIEAILESSPIGITLIKSRSVMWMNRGVTKMLGYLPEEVVHLPVDKFYATEEEFMRVGKELYAMVAARGMGWIETKLKTKSGRCVDVFMQAVPLDENDESKGYIFTFADITNLVKAQEELREYTNRLEESNKELDAFAHSVAHDLKNPLNGVMGFSELLIEDFDELTSEEKMEFLRRIVMQGNKMLEIIDSLLLLSGVRRENIPMDAVNMHQVIENALQSTDVMRNLYDARIEVCKEIHTVIGFAPWLEAVFINLLTNAMKYGGTPPNIQIGCKAQGDFVKFWVQDNGKGLPKEKLNSIFVEFVRLKNDKRGHGLGLSIVKRIINRLHGEVWVESEPGSGSKFGFTLPRENAKITTPVA
jgi:PAS domain S-box-containing protein